MWKDENAKSRRWKFGEYTWTQASCDVDFFVCIHKWRMMYIDSTHHFHGIGISFILEEICFCNLDWSPISVNLYWGWLELISWYLFFFFCPAPLHLSLIPQPLTSWLVSSARPWIWCHFNIGLFLVVQIKGYEQFTLVWHQYLPTTLLLWIQTHSFHAHTAQYIIILQVELSMLLC